MDMGITTASAFDAIDATGTHQPLGWSELCARLVAAQDLRREQAGRTIAAAQIGLGGLAAPGSFHRGAARMLAALSSKEQKIGEGFINPKSSTYRNGNRSTPGDSSEMPSTPRTARQADENRHA